MAYPDLPKSYKSVFPFRLATTSFIYPDDYLVNVQKLGFFVDEIELLFFESAPADALPGGELIDQLARLSEEFALSYNIHLPIDIDPGGEDETVRVHAVKTISRFIGACAALQPTSFTLHVPLEEHRFDRAARGRWETAVKSSFSELLSGGLEGKRLAIETLAYPFSYVEPLIEEFDLSVCIDFGHLALSGQDLGAVFGRNLERTAIVHLHGFDRARDHLSLACAHPKLVEKMVRWIEPFSRCVSLEVFSYAALKSSLEILDKTWRGLTRRPRVVHV
ncbi:MAG: cobamide remodeling phosphodiesterase CbiR [Desulfobacterales bacterium]